MKNDIPNQLNTFISNNSERILQEIEESFKTEWDHYTFAENIQNLEDFNSHIQANIDLIVACWDDLALNSVTELLELVEELHCSMTLILTIHNVHKDTQCTTKYADYFSIARKLENGNIDIDFYALT